MLSPNYYEGMPKFIGIDKDNFCFIDRSKPEEHIHYISGKIIDCRINPAKGKVNEKICFTLSDNEETYKLHFGLGANYTIFMLASILTLYKQKNSFEFEIEFRLKEPDNEVNGEKFINIWITFKGQNVKSDLDYQSSKEKYGANLDFILKQFGQDARRFKFESENYSSMDMRGEPEPVNDVPF